MELNGLGPKPQKDVSAQTAAKAAASTQTEASKSSLADTKQADTSIQISDAAKKLFAKEQVISQNETPSNKRKLEELKKAVETGDYQKNTDVEKLADSIIDFENELHSQKF